MIDFEQLLEFEDSLSQGLSNTNAIILQNLATKIEHFKNNEEEEQQEEEQQQQQQQQEEDSVSTDASISSTPSRALASFTLEQATSNYNILEDDFASCTTCKEQLSQSTKLCCQSTVEQYNSTFSNLDQQYWTLFLENPTRTINTFPYYTELCLKQGIPNSLRSAIWTKLFLLNSATVPKSMSLIYHNFQHSYSAEVSEQIKKDLNRTFPTIPFFKQPQTINDLSTILNVYANYDAELGYCQGLLFLVGVLYHHFKGDCEMTFFALTNVMDLETELHDIFTPNLMSQTLSLWYRQFCNIFQQVDSELYNHLTGFTDMTTFLYQWWLTFKTSHTPDTSIINSVMDFCMFQGWKLGIFKVSLALILVNKPILMSLGKKLQIASGCDQFGHRYQNEIKKSNINVVDANHNCNDGNGGQDHNNHNNNYDNDGGDDDDDEVVYQHMLNEAKWGKVVSDMDYFFGELVFSFDDSLFIDLEDKLKKHANGLDPKVATNGENHLFLHTLHSLRNFSLLKSPLKKPTKLHTAKLNSERIDKINTSSSSSIISSWNNLSDNKRSRSGLASSSYNSQNSSSHSIFSTSLNLSSTPSRQTTSSSNSLLLPHDKMLEQEDGAEVGSIYSELSQESSYSGVGVSGNVEVMGAATFSHSTAVTTPSTGSLSRHSAKNSMTRASVGEDIARVKSGSSSSSSSSTSSSSFGDYFKLPFGRSSTNHTGIIIEEKEEEQKASDGDELEELRQNNKAMKALLERAFQLLDGNHEQEMEVAMLKGEILQAISD